MYRNLTVKKRPTLIIDDVLDFDGKSLPVKIYIEDRKNCFASVRVSGIYLHIPAFLDDEARAETIDRLKAKLVGWLRKRPSIVQPEGCVEYSDGDTIIVGDKQYRLKMDFAFANRSTAQVSGDVISLTLSLKIPKDQQNKHASTLISRCVAHKRLPDLKKKIRELNEKYFNKEINKIAFRHSKSRWGSCSSRGNITISTRLLFAPDDVIEYVCIHEIAHLVEHNHSDRFWALVEKAVPDYKEKLNWLKENSNKCRY